MQQASLNMTMKLGRHRQVSVTDSVIIRTLIVHHAIDTIVKGLGLQKRKEKVSAPWSLDPSGRDKRVSTQIR